ncbi:MAG TPA: hypothetical protein VEC14_08770 [Reyranellaceae bacterium]|nr:hypothetical protein [Reyranellaceae bacterium]
MSGYDYWVKPGECLCQDCLRVLDVGDLVPAENDPPGHCPQCGGQACECEMCLGAIRSLRLGHYACVPLQDGRVIVRWSGKDGAVIADALPPE